MCLTILFPCIYVQHKKHKAKKCGFDHEAIKEGYLVLLYRVNASYLLPLGITKIKFTVESKCK
jgi:hypothetical protein